MHISRGCNDIYAFHECLEVGMQWCEMHNFFLFGCAYVSLRDSFKGHGLIFSTFSKNVFLHCEYGSRLLCLGKCKLIKMSKMENL